MSKKPENPCGFRLNEKLLPVPAIPKLETVVIELDFAYTPNEEDVYVYLKNEIKDRSLTWDLKRLAEASEIGRLREENECLLAMKAGVEIRITDLNARLCEQRDTICRLRKLVESGKEDHKAIDELVDENLRLRGLIWDMVDNARYENEEETAVLTKDFDKLEKEVGDE